MDFDDIRIIMVHVRYRNPTLLGGDQEEWLKEELDNEFKHPRPTPIQYPVDLFICKYHPKLAQRKVQISITAEQ